MLKGPNTTAVGHVFKNWGATPWACYWLKEAVFSRAQSEVSAVCTVATILIYFASIYIDSVYVVDVVHKAHKETDSVYVVDVFHLGLLFCHSVSWQWQPNLLTCCSKISVRCHLASGERRISKTYQEKQAEREAFDCKNDQRDQSVTSSCRFLTLRAEICVIWLVPRHPNWRTEVSSHIRSSYTFSSCSVWSHLVWVQYGHLCFAEVEDAQFEVHALTASWEAHTLKAWHLWRLPFSKLQFFKRLKAYIH